MTADSNKVRWGVISTALIGTEKVIPGMQAGSCCDIQAIASRELGKAEQAAAALGIPKAYGSYEELLADPTGGLHQGPGYSLLENVPSVPIMPWRADDIPQLNPKTPIGNILFLVIKIKYKC